MQVHELRAILFSDIVGFSVKMAVDERATMAMLQRNAARHERVVKNYDGDLVDSMGDGFLCVFTSSQQAVLAGLALQADLAASDEDTQLRVGVHVGDTIIVRNKNQIKDVFGDAVNIAARIESNAPAPGVWISSRVAEDLRNHPDFQLQSAGFFNLKNIPEAMEIFAVQVLDAIQLRWAADPGRTPVSKPWLRLPPWLIALIAVIALSVGALTTWFALQVEPDTLAVLPITLISKNDDLAYLAIAIQDRLLSEIPQSDTIRLISQASAQKLLDANEQFRDEELDYFIEGTLRIEAQSGILQLRLIETDTDALLLSFAQEGALDELDALASTAAAEFSRFLASLDSGNFLQEALPLQIDAIGNSETDRR
ncbi:adenylate/guanylate cyclase domain-containing protein [Reinekea sp.]|uniref:adenylate/guanylate cyclase domain-containing protein n=1 Tax=Reinekea sp. TaxID=1970455 RepID=UPI002A80790E|nr:adenylate/guanylate cyclase domain-containing protein [Reinekea sp.]